MPRYARLQYLRYDKSLSSTVTPKSSARDNNMLLNGTWATKQRPVLPPCRKVKSVDEAFKHNTNAQSRLSPGNNVVNITVSPNAGLTDTLSSSGTSSATSHDTHVPGRQGIQVPTARPRQYQQQYKSAHRCQKQENNIQTTLSPLADTEASPTSRLRWTIAPHTAGTSSA